MLVPSVGSSVSGGTLGGTVAVRDRLGALAETPAELPAARAAHHLIGRSPYGAPYLALLACVRNEQMQNFSPLACTHPSNVPVSLRL